MKFGKPVPVVIHKVGIIKKQLDMYRKFITEMRGLSLTQHLIRRKCRIRMKKFAVISSLVALMLILICKSGWNANSGQSARVSRASASSSQSDWSGVAFQKKLRGANVSTCDIIRNSLFIRKKIVLFRVLGASLPPLQSPLQTEINLRHILRNENEVTSSSNCIFSFWVFNCMNNVTNWRNLKKILSEFNQQYFTVPGCSKDSHTQLRQILNVNKARNYGLKLAKQLYDPEWILPLDGNVFIPREGLRVLVSTLARDTVKNYLVRSIPLFRALKCQSTIFTDSFSITREFQRLPKKKVFESFPAISDFLSRKQEGQLAISTKLTNITNFFSESFLYSLASKLSAIKEIPSMTFLKFACGRQAGWEKENESRKFMYNFAAECGFVIRLLYWPERDECASTQNISMRHLPRKDLRGRITRHGEELMKKSEVNRSLRGRLRDISVVNLASELKMN